ncbi:MAG: energy transducer TonB family protein [Planctomycetota bacterium]
MDAPDAKLDGRRWRRAVVLSCLLHVGLLAVGNWAFDASDDGRDEGIGEVNTVEIVALSPEEVSALLSRKGAPQAPRLLEAPDASRRSVVQGPAPLDLVRPIQNLRNAPSTPQAVMLDVPRVLLETDSSGLLSHAGVEILDAPWQGEVADGGGSGSGAGALPSPDRVGIGDLEVGSEGAAGDAAPLLDGRMTNQFTLYRQMPNYTRDMRERGVEGRGMWLIEVNVLGRVIDVTTLVSTGEAELDRITIDALEAWIFDPKELAKGDPPYRFRAAYGFNADD